MSNRLKILELLKQNELTVKEIAGKTEFNENEVRVYIHRLLKDNLIEEIGKKERYCIYSVIEKKSSENMDKFKRLYEIMNLYLIGKLTPKEIAKIPESILKEIEQIEEEFNFD